MVSGSVGGVAGTAEESELVGRLREGDERAFEEAVDALYPAMFAVARGYVRVRSVAEEVVQDGWVAILDGLERFEGRSSLRTWVLQIVANIARDRGAREGRSLPFSALEVSEEEPLVEPERFLRRGEPFPGGWKVFPTDWRTLPESRVLARETRDVVDAAITSLPDSQQLVMMLRDVVGCRAEEVSEALGITAANERVLLHRARVRVRAELERYFDG
jgi:RNA polymerase sigma-70 factor (ECF subfamily)